MLFANKIKDLLTIQNCISTPLLVLHMEKMIFKVMAFWHILAHCTCALCALDEAVVYNIQFLGTNPSYMCANKNRKRPDANA
jgi:hypothetical protein